MLLWVDNYFNHRLARCDTHRWCVSVYAIA